MALAILDEAHSGALAFNVGATLARVAVAFIIAMALGSVIGLIMGQSRIADRLGDPWLIVLLNLPALVIIVLAYVWAGLTETAAVAAVSLRGPQLDRLFNFEEIRVHSRRRADLR